MCTQGGGSLVKLRDRFTAFYQPEPRYVAAFTTTPVGITTIDAASPSIRQSGRV
ncbi:Uncharacterised protein [Vibrio cholerae]|nr:Uncharacterised protein [Vibrio cholerae]